MKKFKMAAMALAAMLIIAGGRMATAQEWSANLLQNPGAETGTIEGWTANKDDFKAYQEYQEKYYPYKGFYFFRLHSLDEATQVIDVSEYASAIDSSNALIKAGIWMQAGYEYAKGRIRIKFSNQEGFLGVETSELDGATKWSEITLTATVPAGTRSIEYKISEEANYDISLDDAYLNISGEPPPDADNDGVPDAQDQCPDTVPNIPVDEKGCSALKGDFNCDGKVDILDAVKMVKYIVQDIATLECK